MIRTRRLRSTAWSSGRRSRSEPLPQQQRLRVRLSAHERHEQIHRISRVALGQNRVAEGAATYAAKCAMCHGPGGENGKFDRLVGRDAGENFAFAKDARLVKTIGNYWPYATTLFDYTARSMPFPQPGTLSANETYGLVAYLLSLNKIVPDTAVMDKTTLPKVVMPAHDRFVMDNRAGGPKVK